MEMHVFFQNPDFDEVFIFHNLEIPTSKKQFKPIGEDVKRKIQSMCPEIDYPLYLKSNKENAQSFINEIKHRLLTKRKNKWPYKEKILLTVGVTGTKRTYGGKDLDNILKSIFDAFKGIVFEDDNQIEAVISSKQIIPQNILGFIVGLRVLPNGVNDKYLPKLFSSRIEDWGSEYNERFSKPSTELFGSFEIY